MQPDILDFKRWERNLKTGSADVTEGTGKWQAPHLEITAASESLQPSYEIG